MEGRCSKVILTEASLGRVLQHVRGNDKVKSWAVLTAYRYMNTPAQNKEANKQLQSEIRSKNLGFIQMEGHWQECQDRKVNYSDCPKDKLVDSIEISLFVPNLSKVDAHKLGNNYIKTRFCMVAMILKEMHFLYIIMVEWRVLVSSILIIFNRHILK